MKKFAALECEIATAASCQGIIFCHVVRVLKVCNPEPKIKLGFLRERYPLKVSLVREVLSQVISIYATFAQTLFSINHLNGPELITSILEIKAGIESVKKNLAVYKESNFCGRTNAIDFLEFHIIDRIEGLEQQEIQSNELSFLRIEAEAVKEHLEKINIGLFRQIRKKIRSAKHIENSFKKLIAKYIEPDDYFNSQNDEMGYSNFDIFINGVLSDQDMPAETRDREAEMVFFQKTPAGVVFDMINRAELTNDDVFFDLGSGLGQVCILVKLMTEADAVGIEFEPAYSDFANASARGLNLKKIKFISIDARQANYTTGTVFFMYTPFEGEIMLQVLEILREESQKRTIRIFAYGPCTIVMAQQDWLTQINDGKENLYKLCLFSS
jgi:hypothetical protein